MKRNRKKSGRGMTRKALAAFLAASVVLTQAPMTIYAEDAAEKGLCAHHTQHTEECGYREAKAAVPCGHICSAENGCITTAKSCMHTHGAECYPEGNTEGEPSLCTHVCSEESGCITKAENCVHTHDASCGYGFAGTSIEATMGGILYFSALGNIPAGTYSGTITFEAEIVTE